MVSAAEDAVNAAVYLTLTNTDPESIHVWWQAYRVADEVTRKRMLRVLEHDARTAL